MRCCPVARGVGVLKDPDPVVLEDDLVMLRVADRGIKAHVVRMAGPNWPWLTFSEVRAIRAERTWGSSPIVRLLDGVMTEGDTRMSMRMW